MSEVQVSTRFLFLILFLAFAAFSGVEAQQITGAKLETSGTAYRSGVEEETFSLINQYRKTSKLPPLVWDSAIAKAARAHSKDMATGEVDFGHDGFGDRVSGLKTALPGLWGAGENVFMSDNLDQIARNAVTMWLHSPHHLKNIRGDYNYSGLGVWQDKNGAIYFTQIFVNIKPPTREAQAAPASSVNTPFGMLASPETRTTR